MSGLGRVVFTRLPDGTGTLLHLDTMGWYTLNRSGVALWEALARGDGPDAVSAALVRDHGLAEVEADDVVASFLAALRDAGLVG